MLGKLISRLKKEDYTITYDFSARETIRILFDKAIQILRGFVKVKIKASTKGLVFAAKGANVIFSGKVSFGRNLNMGRYSLINALSVNGVKIGDNFTIGDFSIIECTGVLRGVGEGLTIGNNVGINHHCFIGVRGEIVIGDNVIFGPRVTVLSENHNFNLTDVPIKEQGETRYKTVIEDDVWIGANVIIMPGVTIKSGSIVGSGAVVTKDTQKDSVVVGVPAKIVKKRNEKDN
ncbi:acyltransferase [Spongiivirga citrea]|uniref:Acyltransferase n=1 Tax=Spongiivirga citrea TaxID=1481457 RepID=A0A6M0CLZ6_9FLAO|nr:DapH/DapD/GlmU-related protein [Spongiivirga citrea]NER18911.1 acyltransferase [Spongiivirga citrea]